MTSTIDLTHLLAVVLTVMHFNNRYKLAALAATLCLVLVWLVAKCAQVVYTVIDEERMRNSIYALKFSGVETLTPMDPLPPLVPGEISWHLNILREFPQAKHWLLNASLVAREKWQVYAVGSPCSPWGHSYQEWREWIKHQPHCQNLNGRLEECPVYVAIKSAPEEQSGVGQVFCDNPYGIFGKPDQPGCRKALVLYADGRVERVYVNMNRTEGMGNVVSQ